MNRKETTKAISDALENYLNPNLDTRIYLSKEVTFDYATGHQTRVDYMLFKPINNSISGIEKGDFYCYEIKSCVDDFKSKNGHNFYGDYNYYVMTLDTYEQLKSYIPRGVGVYTLNALGVLHLAKKAVRTDRKYPFAVTLMMMFRSANREYFKNRRKEKANEKI